MQGARIGAINRTGQLKLKTDTSFYGLLGELQIPSNGKLNGHSKSNKNIFYSALGKPENKNGGNGKGNGYKVTKLVNAIGIMRNNVHNGKHINGKEVNGKKIKPLAHIWVVHGILSGPDGYTEITDFESKA